MTAILTGPSLTVDTEPEPEHERVPDGAPTLPPLPERVPGRTLRASASLADTARELEREDDARGYEPEDRAAACGALLLRLLDEGDRRAAAAGRTVPRTAGQMRARLAAAAGGAR
ncbi:hypothetical protein WDH52_06380 [Streptomyces sp. TRM70308]|uniref:hypothetical protein n=1 Tax=Streptomyces sp. TRM70308 TaxID=3131932 RepID=UPI003CFC236D